MLLDLTVADQSYVEDCEVCCNPISLRFRVEEGAGPRRGSHGMRQIDNPGGND